MMYQGLQSPGRFQDTPRLDKTYASSIAIIDDLESNRSFLEHMAWRQHGVRYVCVFESAIDALTAFEKTPPDLVVTDFHMPGMNAVEFLDEFRQRPEFEDVPVIVISGRNEVENRRRALLAGATDFLMVPFDPIEFQARAHNLLTLSLHQKGLRTQSRSLRSELQETRHQSEESRHHFTSIIDSVPALVFAVNAEGACVFANHYCFELLGVPPGEGPRGAQPLAEKVAQNRSGRSTRDGGMPEEISLTGRDGREHVFLIAPKGINCGGHGNALIVYSGIEISRLKETERSLRQAKEEAEAANRAKSAFLSNMTHEIRTPLNAIMGFTQVISSELHGPIGNETYKQYLLDIQTSAHHLLSVLNEILDFSQIEAERYSVDVSRFDLRDCLGDVAHIVEPQLAANGNRLLINDAPDLRLLTDQRKLVQVLLNLVSNANHATRNGTVRVSAEQEPDGGVTVAISDNGVGMNEGELALAITEFGRAMTSPFVSDSHSGTGLGLPISIGLMKLLGGAVTIESEKGKGTTVRVTLPATAVLLPPDKLPGIAAECGSGAPEES
jgi:signal transduction histidine kinase/DNA-binding NarL/FixJ family response regulator